MTCHTHDPKLSDAGFLDLLRELQRRCAEPEQGDISSEGREAVFNVRKAIEAYLNDLGWNSVGR